MIDTTLINISDFLREEITEPIIYVANSGNAGDALMACATYDLFDKLGIAYINVTHAFLADPSTVENRIVVLAGGGNFNEAGYNTYPRLLEQIHDRAKKIIVLPHTISQNENLLSRLGKHVTLICREQISFNHVSNAAPKARVLRAHDMAFMLDVDSILNFRPRYLISVLKKLGARLADMEVSHSYPTIRAYGQGLWLSRPWGGAKRHSREDAYLYRMDIESTDIPIPEGNLDASLTFNFGVTSPMKARYTVHHLLKFLSGYEVIHTNRLHITIASALLNKTVNFHANNYYKCRAVFEHSIMNRFPNVIWHG